MAWRYLRNQECYHKSRAVKTTGKIFENKFQNKNSKTILNQIKFLKQIKYMISKNTSKKGLSKKIKNNFLQKIQY